MRQPLIHLFDFLRGQHFAPIELGNAGLDLADLPLVQLDIGGDGFGREKGLRALRAPRQRAVTIVVFDSMVSPLDDANVYNSIAGRNAIHLCLASRT